MIESDFDYSTSSQSSSSINITSSPIIKMPLVRRRRSIMRLSSSPVTQVDAQGTAYLCFPEDHSWFQGNISTEDESNYSLYGERVTVKPETEEKSPVSSEQIIQINKNAPKEENNNAAATEPEAVAPTTSSSTEESDYYRVTMIDHFSGQKYILPKIIAKKQPSLEASSGVGNLFASQHEEVTFEVENVYKGQKADIMIHRYLGSPSLLGKKCLLYTGQINILFNDTTETGKSWSL
ncbi:unnamed protein product [Orchesella dallaii]|uniref:Uncharacterized protein n=1 Tax=Orchesella dallaii TaxID=48710 RepID=A0ABP1Q0S0_9HEXA